MEPLLVDWNDRTSLGNVLVFNPFARRIIAYWPIGLVFERFLDQQTSRKKRLFWSMTLFLDVFSQLIYFGSDRAIQPKRPKMAEIWLKSNFLCISMVSHPITSLPFTIATLVALIDPWRVWLDSWGLRFQAWAPRYALSFILCRGGALFRDWMPIGRNFNAVWHVLFRFWLAKLYHLRQVCVCLRVGLHAYNYLFGVIHQT